MDARKLSDHARKLSGESVSVAWKLHALKMQVQCDRVTYFALSQVLEVVDQRVTHTFTMQDILPYHEFPLLSVDLNQHHDLLGIAWRDAPSHVVAGHVLEANPADQVAVIWLNPLCKCANHHTYNYSQVFPRVYLTVACEDADPSGHARLPCYIKLSKMNNVSGWTVK